MDKEKDNALWTSTMEKTLVKVLGIPITAHEMIKIQKNRPPPSRKDYKKKESSGVHATWKEQIRTKMRRWEGGKDSTTLYLKPKQDMRIQRTAWIQNNDRLQHSASPCH